MASMTASAPARTYDAFLSYSHADMPVAEAVQKGLHRIGRRVGQLRALRVYRDATDLAANPGFWAKLEEALSDSRYFVAVLSPAAARSTWVDREISTWIEQHGVDHILMVLADGDLVWDTEHHRFDPDRSSALPPSMARPGLFRFEPLWVDLRDFAEGDLGDLSPGPLRSRLVDLAAPIHERPKEELDSEDRRELRRFRRYRRFAVAGLLVLLITSVAAAAVATQQRNEARRQAQIASARELAARSIAAEDPDRALALALVAGAATEPPLIEARSAFAAASQRHLGRAAVPVGPPRRHHTDDVRAVAASPDGRVASAADDGTVMVWEVGEPDDQVRTLASFEAGIGALSWAPDGGRLVVGTDEGDAFLLDATDGRVRGETSVGEGGLGAVAFHPDGSLIALATNDGALALWDGGDGVEVVVDGQREAGDGGYRAVAVWSPDGSALLHATPDESLAVVGAGDESIAALDAQVGAIRAAAWSENAIAVGGTGGIIEVFDPDTYEFTLAVDHRGDWVDTVTVTPEGDLIAAGGHDSTIRFFDPESGRSIGEPLTSHSGWINAMSWSGRTLLSASTDRTVLEWERTSADVRHELFPSALDSELVVRPISWSPDGTMLAGGASDASIRVWSVTDAVEILRLDGHDGDVSALDWSPDGAWLASGDGTGEILVWDSRTGEPVARSRAHDDVVSSVAWNDAATEIASGSLDGTIVLTDLNGDELLVERDDAPVTALAWRGDSLLVADEDGRVYDPLVSGPDEPVFADPAHAVNAIAIGPDGRIAIGLGDSTMAVLTPDGEQLARGSGHNAEILGIDWAPSGTLVASSSADATIRLWDAATGRAIGPPLRQPDWNADAVAVQWSPGGERLATTLLLGTVQVWSGLTQPSACATVERAVPPEALVDLWHGTDPCADDALDAVSPLLPVAP